MMSFSRRCALALAVGLFVCGGVFAQNIMDTYFNGNLLNDQINSYISNVSNLIPDLTTLQDVQSYNPGAVGRNFWFSAGVNGNVSFLERTQVGNMLSGAEAFGSSIDLAQFPDGIPFLPGVSLDVKFGYKNYFLGLAGMWLDQNILDENFGTTFLGEGSSFALRSLGVTFGYIIFKERKLIPAVIAMAGYYYTGYNFGVEAANESVNIDFRNDSYLVGAQVSKGLLDNFITPYAGIKVMFSKTDSEYEWNTDRACMINGKAYLDGVTYSSAGNDGDVKVYSQFYAGAGVLIYQNYLLSVGGAYTIGTDHFTLNFSLKFIM